MTQHVSVSCYRLNFPWVNLRVMQIKCKHVRTTYLYEKFYVCPTVRTYTVSQETKKETFSHGHNSCKFYWTYFLPLHELCSFPYFFYLFPTAFFMTLCIYLVKGIICRGNFSSESQNPDYLAHCPIRYKHFLQSQHSCLCSQGPLFYLQTSFSDLHKLPQQRCNDTRTSSGPVLAYS